mmetsp:Transcript_4033/g.9187  ORF Transcript_4033/g.9187 Transcript_4033/m.9187 type:complete len:92 (-) Transcript_4033:385-660(-)
MRNRVCVFAKLVSYPLLATNKHAQNSRVSCAMQDDCVVYSEEEERDDWRATKMDFGDQKEGTKREQAAIPETNATTVRESDIPVDPICEKR